MSHFLTSPVTAHDSAPKFPRPEMLQITQQRVHMNTMTCRLRCACPWVVITDEMMEEARCLAPQIQLHQTRANRFDSLTGTLGELGFAQWYYGDWRRHHVSANFGDADFPGTEIKCGLIEMRLRLHLIAKESYVRNRPADFYVQTFIDSRTPRRGPLVGDTLYVAGWTTKSTLLSHGRRTQEVTREGRATGIQTLRLPLAMLSPMAEFRSAYAGREGGAQ